MRATLSLRTGDLTLARWSLATTMPQGVPEMTPGHGAHNAMCYLGLCLEGRCQYQRSLCPIKVSVMSHGFMYY